jgi:hypothetical protein
LTTGHWEVADFLFCFFVFNRAALGEAFNGESAFADSLEAFGGGLDDPISTSIGGCWDQ